MKRFLDYYLMREDKDDDKGLGDIDAMPNEDEFLMKLAKMAISRHQERLVDFFNALSKHDDDIKRLLGQYKDKRKNYLPQDLRIASKLEKDIVAPSSADMNEPV
jgi:hypothetical protein